MPDIEDCLRRALAIRGAWGASLVDFTNGTTLASVGGAPAVADLIRATVHSGVFAGPGRPGHLEDLAITAGNGYHVVRFVGTGGSDRWALYLWLDRVQGNLAMAQLALRSIATAIVAA